jgi:hypothetical protein
MDESDAIINWTKKITKIKVAEWGTPKKYLKKLILTNASVISFIPLIEAIKGAA